MTHLLRTTLALVLVGSAAGAADNSEKLFHESVAPLFASRCIRCHGNAEPKGGLNLATAKTALAGGDSGAAIVPGQPDDSPLLTAVSGDKPQMPKEGAPLAADEVAVIRRWIAEGASWPTGVVLADERAAGGDWWSLEPLAHVAVPSATSPWVRTPVDAFILARLDEQRLAPAAEADRRTLIRRLTYDLHGLPPTPEEVDAFTSDSQNDAYERLVDRLLASPRYGERWGRYWLDVVHYGESHGYDKDKPRPHAWPYRDWVIASLNDDKPYDRFVAEQIAGDVLAPSDPQATVATGFIAAGPWDFVGHVELREGTVDKEIARSNDRDDMVANTMSTFVSLTVHCARCHNHKFDPIRQADYYAAQAVFAGVERADREYGVAPEIARRREKLSGEIGRLEGELAAERKKEKEQARQSGSAELIRSLEAEQKGVEAALAALPPRKLVYAAAHRFAPQGSFTPSAAAARPIFVLARGDVRNPREPAAPAGVACVEGLPSRFELAADGDEGQRRAALARWLADPRNALVRRSIVNRVWHYHFGQGLVDTPNDFGRMGSPPTHPDLLEWLAGWFADQGHSLKRLHRLLVTSAVYRQSSRGNEAYARLDAGNRFLWRMNRQRLDAECIRDSMLAVCGRLDLAMGGPSVQQFFFKDDHSPIYDYERFDVDDPRSLRRSVYRFLVRSVPDPFMECLDCADPSIMTPRRNTTLTSIQALALLNNPLVVRQAEHFAERLRGLASDGPAQIEAAYRLALGRRPTADESAAMLKYAERHGLANACRVLFNTNEFVFMD